MKKTLVVAIILFVADVAVAQRFFQSYEVVPYMYKDDVFYSASEWKELFEKPGKPQSHKIDSLESYARHPNRPWNYGIQFRAQKVIPVYKESLHRVLEWSIGPGYHVLKNSLHQFTTRNMIFDTTKPLEREIESFDLTYHYLDLYTSLAVRSTKGPVHVSIGFGIQGSLPIGKSYIEEQYDSLTWKWNTTVQTWEQLKQPTAHFSSMAVKTYIFSFTVPFALSFDIGNNSETKFGLEYFNSRRSPRVGQPHSEGIMIQLGFRCGLGD